MAPIEQMTVIDDRYEIVEPLDVGGMGVVFRATDRRLGRPVAVKVVRTSDARLAQRTTREARLLARVDHPNVVRVFDAGVHHDHPYIVTELVAGRPLSRLMADGPLSPEQTAAVGAGAAAGLAATHRAGIVHRDLKPANILVSDLGIVRLLDYGVASIADVETLTLDGEVVGTPRYLAPEQVSGDEIGPAADVYALGLVLLECLTARHPFAGTAIESMAARLTRDPDVPDALADPWPALLAAMTGRDPGRRPPAAEVAERLAGVGSAADLRSLAGLDDTVAGRIVTGRQQVVGSHDDARSLAPGDVTAELPTMTMPRAANGAAETGGASTRPRRRRLAVVLLTVVLVASAAAVGARVVTDRAGTGSTVPTTASTAPPSTSSSTRAPTTTIRPTTTTAPPTTTTTAPRRGGRPGRGPKPSGG